MLRHKTVKIVSGEGGGAVPAMLVFFAIMSALTVAVLQMYDGVNIQQQYNTSNNRMNVLLNQVHAIMNQIDAGQLPKCTGSLRSDAAGNLLVWPNTAVPVAVNRVVVGTAPGGQVIAYTGQCVDPQNCLDSISVRATASGSGEPYYPPLAWTDRYGQAYTLISAMLEFRSGNTRGRAIPLRLGRRNSDGMIYYCYQNPQANVINATCASAADLRGQPDCGVGMTDAQYVCLNFYYMQEIDAFNQPVCKCKLNCIRN